MKCEKCKACEATVDDRGFALGRQPFFKAYCDECFADTGTAKHLRDQAAAAEADTEPPPESEARADG